jgi:50S ribosomal subunit-associated GTPase HflX
LTAHFAELKEKIDHNKSTKRSKGMEDAHRTYNHEDEVRGLYVSMGNEGTKSNGHREGKEESMNLVETIKSLQKDVQSYKDDNERLMKSKEKQDGFNIKLL